MSGFVKEPSSGFEGNKGCEIKPLGEGLHAGKTRFQQEFTVLFQGKWDQDIFKSLLFLAISSSE